MRWIKPNLRSSIYALLGQPEPAAPGLGRIGLNDIRRAMLDLLGESAERDFPAFFRRVLAASDVQTLWYARSDLFGALAAQHGESRAREMIDPVNRMFDGLLPASLYARPGPRR